MQCGIQDGDTLHLLLRTAQLDPYKGTLTSQGIRELWKSWARSPVDLLYLCILVCYRLGLPHVPIRIICDFLWKQYRQAPKDGVQSLLAAFGSECLEDTDETWVTEETSDG